MPRLAVIATGFKYDLGQWFFYRCRVLFGMLLCLLNGCESPPESFGGYIEGEYLYLAVREAGYLQALAVERGQRVKQGQKLFQLNTDWQQLLLEEAEARLTAAEYRLQNLLQPHRQTELAELRAHLQATEAKAELAVIELKQLKVLRERGFVAQIRLDEAQAIFEQTRAEVKAAKEQLARFASALGRSSEIQAAEADVLAAKAIVAQRRDLNERQTLFAPADGEIYDTYYQIQEWVAAGAAVASLLTDDQRRIRFFVPESQRALIEVGHRIKAYCDQCGEPIIAQIVFISSTAEYTPPVIFSQNRRSKLVFRVEAKPDSAAPLPVGLPVDVRLDL
jgi:HlyD family secretion protein